MSEYYLRRYDLNQAKNSIKRIGNQIGDLGWEYRSVRSLLSGQRGLGVERIRDQLNLLRSQSGDVREDIRALGDLLERIIRETEAADNEARKILGGFSVREQERILSAVKEILQFVIKLFLAWAGGEATAENSKVSWAKSPIDLLKIFNDGISGDDLKGFAENVMKSVSKFLGKESLYKNTGLSRITSGHVASWAVDWIVDTIENFTDGNGSFFDDIRETMVEGLIGGGKVLGIAAVTAAVVATLPATASAGAVAAVSVGVGFVVSWLLDKGANAVFNNEEGFVENTGDIVCDWLEQMPM